MNFALTEEQKKIQEKARAFAERELASGAQERDLSEEFPMYLIKKLGEEGLIGLQFPKEYGGQGKDYLSFILVVEELSKVDSAFGIAYAISSTFTTGIYLFGNDAQKKHCMPRLFRGDALGCFALTEPDAGSDAGSARTTAIFDRETNEYVLNGTKCFISGGSRAGVVIVFALTDPSKGTRGMSAIIVEKGTPGFTVGKVENKMGLGGSETAELIFEDCRVPAANFLGKEGQGFKIAMQALDGARIGVGAQAMGVAEAAVDLSVKYANERVQFGKPIAALQGIQWYIADMATKTEAAKALVYHAAYLADSGQPFTKMAAMCKLNASENARFVTNLALQIHGGYGYMKEYPLERMYRDAKITEIYEGTSEIHKVVIAREVMR